MSLPKELDSPRLRAPTQSFKFPSCHINPFQEHPRPIFQIDLPPITESILPHTGNCAGITITSFHMTPDRDRLIAMLTALDASPVALRRPVCRGWVGDWQITGKLGHIIPDGPGFLIYVATDESPRRWGFVKQRVVVLLGKDGHSTEIKAWSVFLTIDRPISAQQVLVTSSGSLPKYEVKDRDSRSVVVAFMGDLVDTTLDIKVTVSVVPTSSVSAPSTTPHYTERDIRELLDALTEAQNLNQNNIFPVITAIQSTAVNWRGAFRNVYAAGLIKALKDEREHLQSTVWQAIDDFVYVKNARHVEQIRTALALDDDAAKGDLTRAFQPVKDALSKLPQNPSDDTLDLIAPQFQELAQQANLAYQWFLKIRTRLPEMQNNLRTKGVTGYEKT